VRSVVLVLAAAAVLAGCGGGGSDTLTPSEYRARLAQIQKDSAREHGELDRALVEGTVAELEAGLRRYADAAEDVADELDEVKPPEDAAGAHAELAKSGHDAAAAVREALPRIAEASSVAAALIILERSEAAAKADQEGDHALDVLQKLGYLKGS